MPELKVQLGEYLDHVLQRIDVDEIVHERIGAGPVRPIQVRRSRRSVPRWTYGAAAAAVAVLLFGGLAYLVGQQVDSASLPVDPSIGLVGLPPEGAAPSTPPTGELVASMWSHRDGDPGGAASLYLYADGRLIRSNYQQFGSGADDFIPGWVEQRLTPEGIALIHDEIISTGLFDPDRPVRGTSPPAYGAITVRVGDQLVWVWGWGSTPPIPAAGLTSFQEIHDRLRQVDSWLPADAWDDRVPVTYVPSTYAVCVGTDAGQPADPSDLVALLPTPAWQLLAGARHFRAFELGDIDPGAGATQPRYSPHCYEVTTDDARSLVAMLEQAGFDHGLDDLGFAIDYTDPLQRTAIVIFTPMMPHGAPAG